MGDGTPALRLIPHELIDALAEAAGLDVSDIQRIVMTPGAVRYDILLRDDEGRGRAAGDYAARAKITYPLTRWGATDDADA